MLILRKSCLFPSLPRTAGWDLGRTRHLWDRALYFSTDTPSAPQSGPSPAGHGNALLLAGFGLRGECEQLRGSNAGNEGSMSRGWGVASGELCVSPRDYGHLKLATWQQNISIVSSSQLTRVLSLHWKFKALRENAHVWRESMELPESPLPPPTVSPEMCYSLSLPEVITTFGLPRNTAGPFVLVWASSLKMMLRVNRSTSGAGLLSKMRACLLTKWKKAGRGSTLQRKGVPLYLPTLHVGEVTQTSDALPGYCKDNLNI